MSTKIPFIYKFNIPVVLFLVIEIRCHKPSFKAELFKFPTPFELFIEKETVSISKYIGFTQESTVDLILSSVAGKGVKTEPVFVFKKES